MLKTNYMPNDITYHIIFNIFSITELKTSLQELQDKLAANKVYILYTECNMYIKNRSFESYSLTPLHSSSLE